MLVLRSVLGYTWCLLLEGAGSHSFDEAACWPRSFRRLQLLQQRSTEIYRNSSSTSTKIYLVHVHNSSMSTKIYSSSTSTNRCWSSQSAVNYGMSLLEPQSRFGDKSLGIRVFCPQIGTAVLKGLRVLRSCPHVKRGLCSSKDPGELERLTAA